MSFKRSSGDEAIGLYIGNKGLKPLVLECSNRVAIKHVTKHGRVALTPFNVITRSEPVPWTGERRGTICHSLGKRESSKYQSGFPIKLGMTE